jgi:hypothetical protein
MAHSLHHMAQQRCNRPICGGASQLPVAPPLPSLCPAVRCRLVISSSPSQQQSASTQELKELKQQLSTTVTR